MPVRLLTPSDINAYIALRREMLTDSPGAFASSPQDDAALDPKTVTARMTSPGQVVFGAFDDTSRLLGAAGLYRFDRIKTAHRAGIRGVYVTPSARNQGLATALIRAAFDHTRSWPGVTSVVLAVSEDSPAAQRIYERVGFRVWGREPAAIITGGRAYDEIHMVAFL